MNERYKREPKHSALMILVCAVILLGVIAFAVKFHSIRALITALICAMIPMIFTIIRIITSRNDYVEIHDDGLVFKQGKTSPQKAYWKDISGIAFSGSRHFIHFSAMNIFEKDQDTQLRTVVLLDPTYERYKEMWERIISTYMKSQPDEHNVDVRFFEILGLQNQ